MQANEGDAGEGRASADILASSSWSQERVAEQTQQEQARGQRWTMPNTWGGCLAPWRAQLPGWACARDGDRDGVGEEPRL